VAKFREVLECVRFAPLSFGQRRGCYLANEQRHTAPMSTLLIILLPLCLAISFLCAGMEAGVFALGRWRIRQQAREGRRRAKVLMGYLDQPENFLWTILVANTLAAFVSISLIVFELFKLLRGHPVFDFIAFVAALLLFYATCDLFPKVLFRMYPNRCCMIAAIPFQLIHLLMTPLASLIQRFSNLFLQWTGGQAYTGKIFSSRKELRMAMQHSTEGLTTEERGMITRVLDLQQTTVGQIMLPFWRLPDLQSQLTGNELLNIARDTNRNQLPVWEDMTRRRIAGVVDFRSILYGNDNERARPIRERMTPALYIRDHVVVEEALRRLQRSGQPIAIVLDAARREVGVIGFEEILRSIFGEVKI
jgi:CBS domain containing-hemolysin-like protein